MNYGISPISLLMIMIPALVIIGLMVWGMLVAINKWPRATLLTFILSMLLLALVSSRPAAAQWNPYADMSNGELAWQIGHIVDVAQTLEIDGDCLAERDFLTKSILGEAPESGEVLAWGIAASALHAYAARSIERAHWIPKRVKRTLRALDITVKVGTIANNHAIGIRIGTENEPKVGPCA